MPTFRQAILTCKVGQIGQINLVFMCDQVSLVGLWLCKQDYKFLCAVTTICAPSG